MREIKFRAWNKRTNQFGRTATLIEALEFAHNDPEAIGELDYLEFMQYTGLKDKNGKEIYEGDILSNGNNVIHSITYGDGSFWWGQAPMNIIKRMGELYPAIYKYYEVIGNIYENEELLK